MNKPRNSEPPKPREPYGFPWRWFAFLLLLGLVPLAGYLVAAIHGPQIEREAYANLGALAELRVGQVKRWLDERYSDADVIMSSPRLVEKVAAMQKPGAAGSLRMEVYDRLMELLGSRQYDSETLVDPDGVPLISTVPRPLSPQTLASLSSASESGEVVFSDVVVDSEGTLHFDFVVPLSLFDEGKRRTVGSVILRDNPWHFLFPYLQLWPTPSPTGETLLLRREGDSVVIINELRHRPGAGMSLRLPIGTSGWLAPAARDDWHPGISQGLDYRGVPVLVAFRPVAGTNWVIATKLDRDEVMAPLRTLALWVSLITLLAIAAVGVVMSLFLRQRSRVHQLEMQAQSDRMLRQFFDLPFIGIAIASPTTMRWLKCNDRFCGLTGYSREELHALTWRELIHPDDLDLDQVEIERIRRGESDGFTLDRRFIRKDGATVYVSLDLRCVRKTDGFPEYFLSMFQDITERKAAEARILRLTDLYAALSECNQAIVRCSSEEELFPKVCRVAVEYGGMKMAWIGWLDPETKKVFPVASFGEGTDYLLDLPSSADFGSPYGRGTTGTAIREVRPVWVDDFQREPMLAPWHERAAAFGWASMAALPLARGEETVGALMVYGRDTDAFDEKARNLLVEMASDISFALASFSREKERKQAEAGLKRLKNMYLALSESNEAIVRCSSEEELFPQICRYAVDFGGMIMAWIGRVNPETQNVEPVASYGEGIDFLRGVRIPVSLEESPLACGVTAASIRELKPFWIQDYLNDPRTAPWQEHAVLAGWRGVAAFPLVQNGVAVGALTMYAGEINAFDSGIRDLLSDMAMDISFALDLFSRDAERHRMEESLRESESRFRELYEKAPLPYLSLDLAGNVLEVNEAWLGLFGYSREDVVGRFVGEFMADDSVNLLMQEFSVFRQKGRTDGLIFQFVRKDGERRLMMLNGQMARGKDGNYVLSHCALTDLTERMRAEEQFRLSAKVFEQGGEGIMITDKRVRILMVNRAFEVITGYGQREVVGRSPGFLSSGRHDRRFFRDMLSVIDAAGCWQGEIWNRRKDGSVFPVYISISRVLDGDGQISHYIGTFSDISESKASQEHIRQLAHFDSLTGLPNRSLLSDRVGQALSRMERSGESLALVFLDLDRFKNVNDSLGHRIGDELLVQVSGRLKSLLRDEDTVSRLGGDEFILVLPATDAEGAGHVAEKVLDALSVPYRIEQYELAVTPSLGIAMYPADGATYESLSMCADAAMYRAKQGGRHTFRFFTREMQERSDRTLLLENALRRALELDQLQLYFQPQVSLGNDAIIGAEALLRWFHPVLGPVSPADFIPVAEDSGLILPIGEWVLRTAVRQMRIWLDSGMPPMVMSVNISAVQFRQANLPELVSRILDEVGLPPHCLELELTEGVAMENPLEAIAVMDELHERGVRMSIDDFGTGYSSLNYLKRFKVYKLKIDQSFVRDISRDPEDEAIVETIIGLARNLGVKTIAEGVETEEQAAFLRGKGCDEAQGYLFSRPVPAGEFEAFVREFAR